MCLPQEIKTLQRRREQLMSGRGWSPGGEGEAEGQATEILKRSLCSFGCFDKLSKVLS
jgi:hypothetical protein